MKKGADEVAVEYKETKDFPQDELVRLFSAAGWKSANYPEKLARALKNSSQVISAWDGDKLVGLVRGLDDGELTAFLHYMLVDPDYQKKHIGSGLLTRILAKYRKMLYVKAIPSKPEVVPFFEKFGFVHYDNYTAMQIQNFDKSTDC